ncbi:GSCOCG00007278001-RA-CDS [Cotesia congregata]|nr:GSCOCG00007278001-RA-CDS [Cotesia congregata]
MYRIFFCLIAGSLAVIIEPGPCPNVTAVDINLVDLTGRWFKYASTRNEFDSRHKFMTIYWSYPRNGVTSVVAYSISTKTESLSEIESKVTFNKEDYMLISGK